MSLAELLSTDHGLAARLRVSAPEPKGLRRAVAQISEGDGTQSPEFKDVAALQRRLVTLQSRREHPGSRDVRCGCQVFLLPPHPPGRSTVGPWLLSEVDARKQRAAMHALIFVYLDLFDAGDSDVRALASWLEARRERWPWRDGDPWPDRASRFALFRPDEVPTRLAARALGEQSDPDGALREAGLDGVRLGGGLAEAAFRAACDQTTRISGASAERDQARLLSWARAHDGSLRFPRSWPSLLDGCLLAWGRVEPSIAHKQRLIAELTGFAGGDPRTKPGPWRSVQDRPSLMVLMRWLTRASVLQFLDIVDQSLRDADARRMWAYRRAFWTSYLLGDPAKGEPVIDGAWVAFQSNGALLAERMARGRSDLSSFGRHSLKTSDHSALIVQIGDYVIVDWSHSGKYNVWKKSDKTAPKLYLYKYDGTAANLDEGPFRDSHVGAAHYTWQKKLAEIIEGRPFYNEKPAWRPNVRP